MSNVDRSKCSGGWPDTRSEADIWKYPVAHCTKLITLACVMTTPLGVPVDPEVNRMCAGASLEFRRGTGAGAYRTQSDLVNALWRWAPAVASSSTQPTGTAGTASLAKSS